MATQLPSTRTLPGAIREVIQQNIEVGYRPTRFIMVTQGGDSPNLLEVCTDLIFSPTALDALVDAIDVYPGLLTLEDLIARSRHGRDWGFGEDAIEQAEARSHLFDGMVGKRWLP